MRRRCSRLCNFKMEMRSAYDKFASPGSRLENVLWTPSSKIICVICEGDHVTEAYSSVGRTYVVNARVMSGKLRERKHRIICEARKWVLVTMPRIWSTNFKFGSTIIPRSLTTSERLIISFWKRYWCWELPLPRWSIVHFENEMGSCHAYDHLRIPLSWICRSFVHEMVMLVYSLMSSANSLAVVLLLSKESVMSLMKILKRSGPRTLPCITNTTCDNTDWGIRWAYEYQLSSLAFIASATIKY